MNSSVIFSWLYCVMVIIFVSSVTRAAIISCPPPSEHEQMRPAVRQLCYILEQIAEDMPEQEQSWPTSGRIDVRDATKKREDIDHVFLRFGRRLGL